MSDYKLVLHIDDANLQTMHMARQKIVIRKSTGAGESNVAWLAFRPMASNTVTWSTKYGFYASTTKISSGAVIDRMSQLPTRANPSRYPETASLYALNDAGVFEGTSGKIKDGAYGFVNNYDSEDYLTCGLLLAAVVNGKVVMEPQNAIVVPKGNKMIATPQEKLEVFVASVVDSGSVYTEVVANPFEAVYGGAVNKITGEYSASKAKFIQVDELERGGIEKYIFSAALLCGSVKMLTWSFSNFDLIASTAKETAGVVISQFKDFDTARKSFLIIAATATACAEGAQAIAKVIKDLYPEKAVVDQVSGEADWVDVELKTCQLAR
ncbi:hypothetical protein [Burkholderia stagnalis]